MSTRKKGWEAPPSRHRSRNSAPGWPQASAGQGKRSPFPARGKGASPLPPNKPNLGILLQRYGVELDARCLNQLWTYHNLIRANNQDQDLTRLINFDTIAQRHYADCFYFSGLLGHRWPSPLIDIGTGAGFPGILIKLASPETEIILAEPRPRRVAFLEMVVEKLGLKGIRVFGHKVTSKSFTEPVNGCVSRAFDTIEATLPRMEKALVPGGLAIFMKGPKGSEELAAFENPEYKLERERAYTIPNTTQERHLIVFKRKAQT